MGNGESGSRKILEWDDVAIGSAEETKLNGFWTRLPHSLFISSNPNLSSATTSLYRLL